MSKIDTGPRTPLQTVETGEAALDIRHDTAWVPGASPEPSLSQSPGPGGRAVSAGHPQTLAVRIAHRSRLRLLRAERLGRPAGQTGAEPRTTPPAGQGGLGDIVAAALAATPREGSRDWPWPAARRGQDRTPGPCRAPVPFAGGSSHGARAEESADNSAALAEFLQVLAERIGPLRDPFEPPVQATVPGLTLCAPSGLQEDEGGRGDGVLAFQAAPVQPADGLETLLEAGPGVIRALRRAGIGSLGDLAVLEAEDLRRRLGPAGRLIPAQGWIDAARAFLPEARGEIGVLRAAENSAGKAIG